MMTVHKYRWESAEIEVSSTNDTYTRILMRYVNEEDDPAEEVVLLLEQEEARKLAGSLYELSSPKQYGGIFKGLGATKGTTGG